MQDSLIDQVAYVGWNELGQAARAIVLRFNGLNATGLKNNLDPIEQAWAEVGGLIVTPYHEPWAWMNESTRKYVDELVDGILKRLMLPEGFPVIATGGSMGGHGALAYSMYTKQRIIGVWCNCPVCDLPYHYTERSDLPRTMHHAYGSYGDITSALEANSPVHQVEKLPNVPYLFIHGGKDKSVNKESHTGKLIPLMRRRGMNVTYIEAPNMEHCNPMTWQEMTMCKDFVADLIKNA